MRLSIPTPNTSVVEIGPLTIHFYALCIITGVALVIWLGNRRFTASDSSLHGVVSDVAIVAVPMGVIGGRLYHIVTTPEKYFGSSGSLVDIFKIWNGGLGIWGAISLGTLAALLTYKRMARTRELPHFAIFLDALAPALLFAQAIGRWGNWFNGELFGRPLEAPWALEIPRYMRPAGSEQFETFHPTFLYESLWCALLAIVLLNLPKSLKSGSLFALYIAGYSFGRFFIEGIRIDQAHTIAGLRLNQYVAALIALGGIVAFAKISRAQRGRL